MYGLFKVQGFAACSQKPCKFQKLTTRTFLQFCLRRQHQQKFVFALALSYERRLVADTWNHPLPYIAVTSLGHIQITSQRKKPMLEIENTHTQTLKWIQVFIAKCPNRVYTIWPGLLIIPSLHPPCSMLTSVGVFMNRTASALKCV